MFSSESGGFFRLRDRPRWLPPLAPGQFYAEMKAPKRERDLSTGQLRYKWSETGALEHFRHAHAFDHLASPVASPEMTYV